MKNKLAAYVRLIAAATVLILCGLAFFAETYPLKIFDTQFTAAIRNLLTHKTGIAAIIMLSLTISTLLCGRIYCSFLCPLGLVQELLMFLFKPFHSKRKVKISGHYLFASFSALFLFGMAVGGTVIILRFIDPYAITGNMATATWFGIGFAVLLIILVFFKKRFFCTDICPVGAVLGLLSRLAPFKININADKCKKCGLCAKSCPTNCINDYTVNNETCVKCLKCLSVCRHAALNYGRAPVKQIPFNPERRKLLAVGTAMLLLGVVTGEKIGNMTDKKIKKAILPPGAGDANNFYHRCLNCNLCVRHCASRIIKPATTKIPFVHLDYENGYCDFNCQKCSEVCPSGAIKRITREEKQKTKIGTATVNQEICVSCGLCAEQCPRHIIIKEDGDFPIIPFDKCIGCGACAKTCPVKAIAIKPIDRQIVLN